MECLITHKRTLKILYKSKHFPPRYQRKRERVFLLSEQIPHCNWEVYLGGIWYVCVSVYVPFLMLNISATTGDWGLILLGASGRMD